MNIQCPHCSEPLNTKETLLNSVTTCNSCEKKCCLGNFIQWLISALAAIVCLFLLLVVLGSFDKSVQITFAVGGSVIALLITAIVVVRPVQYSASLKMNEKRH
jgi:glucan phosphoethanolaminetransferase (alkaline phosphatase superfamily)